MYVIQMKKRRRLRIAPKKYVMRMKLVMVTIVVAVLPVIGHRNDAMIGCDGLMLILMYKEHHGSRQRQKKKAGRYKGRRPRCGEGVKKAETVRDDPMGIYCR